MHAAKPRVRRFSSKTRTGCITCKSRHMKCDEARPACLRCLNTGHICRGYPEAVNGRGDPSDVFIHVTYSKVKPAASVASSPDLATLERRSLDFFRHRTAKQLAGSFSDDVWSRVLMQIAQCEPAIGHALIAMGALHEQFECDMGTKDLRKFEFAMRQYSKAIKNVLKLDAVSSASAFEVPLATCIIFASLESIQGHYRSAISQLNNGLCVLQEQQHKTSRSNNTLDDALHPVFLRYNSQLLEIHQITYAKAHKYFAHLDLPAIPEKYDNMNEAMTAFEGFYNHFSRTWGLDGSLRQPTSDGKYSETSRRRRSNIISYLRLWGAAFDNSGFPRRSPPYLILQINRHLVNIILSVPCDSQETAWDQQIPKFERLIMMADDFIKQKIPNTSADIDAAPSDHRLDAAGAPSRQRADVEPPLTSTTSSQDTPLKRLSLSSDSNRADLSSVMTLSQCDNLKPTFSVAIGIIPALYVTVLRCRHPIIRRCALQILEKSNRREGLWDGKRTAQIGQAIVAIEERRATSGSGLVTSASQIPENARIHHIETKFEGGGRGKLRFCFSRRSSQHQDAVEHVFDEEVGW